MVLHPLASLTTEELSTATDLVKANNLGRTCLFRRVYLVEPEKALVVPYLIAENAGQTLPSPPARHVQVLFYLAGALEFYEALIDVGARKVIAQSVLDGMHGAGDDEEMSRVSQAALASPIVQKELKRLQIPDGWEVVAEPWPYGTGDDPQSARLFEVWMFANSPASKHHPSANFYAHPLDFAAVVEGQNFTVIRIDHMPTTEEWKASTDPTNRFQVNPDAEYAPELLPGGVRKDLKPLQINQPEGVSFTVEGELVRWQKWSFILNFDVREGMILRNVMYEGRPIFYRISNSEMVVPYGDPRSPVHRKSAYDFGECGAGQAANNLQLGCDCLGVIHYIDGLSVSPDGTARKMPNVICMHEQDAGIGWKHTNVRTGRADVTRARELVLQLILTVGNYEYALYWIFDTAGVLHWETRATGIMSVTPISDAADTKAIDWGTVVAPGVFAPHHQHMFNIRIDSAIDSYTDSTVVYDETVPMERNPIDNPYGVGFKTVTTKVDEEAAFNLKWETNRVLKMVNPKKLNKISKKPVGYKIVAPPTQLGLADLGSMHSKRGEFVHNHVHVTKQSDKEMWAAGEHPWQSVGGQGGCRTWAERKQPLTGGDSVVWLTLGFTHTTKAEDWPVMPCEVFRLHFKPVGFFDANPALDMPPSTQAMNRSRHATVQKPVEGKSGCCAFRSGDLHVISLVPAARREVSLVSTYPATTALSSVGLWAKRRPQPAHQDVTKPLTPPPYTPLDFLYMMASTSGEQFSPLASGSGSQHSTHQSSNSPPSGNAQASTSSTAVPKVKRSRNGPIGADLSQNWEEVLAYFTPPTSTMAEIREFSAQWLDFYDSLNDSYFSSIPSDIRQLVRKFMKDSIGSNDLGRAALSSWVAAHVASMQMKEGNFGLAQEFQTKATRYYDHTLSLLYEPNVPLEDRISAILDLRLGQMHQAGAAASNFLLLVGAFFIQEVLGPRPTLDFREIYELRSMSLREFAYADVLRSITALEPTCSTVFNLVLSSYPPQSSHSDLAMIEEARGRDEKFQVRLGLPVDLLMSLANTSNLAARRANLTNEAVLKEAGEIERAIMQWRPRPVFSIEGVWSGTRMVSELANFEMWRQAAFMYLHSRVYRTGCLATKLRSSLASFLKLSESLLKSNTAEPTMFSNSSRACAWFLAATLAVAEEDRETCRAGLKACGEEKLMKDNLGVIEAFWQEVDETGLVPDWREVAIKKNLSVGFL